MYYEWRYGLGMMLQCNALNDEWAKWAEEAQWQTGYFGVGSLLVRSIVKARRFHFLGPLAPPPSPLLGLPTLPRLLPPGTHPAPPATSHTPRRPPQATYDLEVEKARVKERSSSPASIIPQRDPSNELEERCLAPSAKAAAPAPRDFGLRKRAK